MAGEASWAVTLPNQYEPFGNILQKGIAQRGEQNQMLYSQMLRDRQQQASNERTNINLIQEEAKAKDLATGNTTFDNWLGGEYDKALREIMTLPLSTIPPAELFGRIKEKFTPLTQTAMKLKNTINTIDENTKMVGSELTDIDSAKLAAKAKENAINDLMPIDNNTGLRNYMPQNFKPDRNYVSEVMQSPDSWELIKDGSGLINFVKNYKTSPVHLEKMFPDKSIKGYTGRKSPFVSLNVKPDANDRIKATEDPAFNIDVQEDFITDGGQQKPVKILSDQSYDLLQSDAKAARGLEHLWGKYKKENNLSFANPVEDEKRKRMFAVDVIKGADVSEISGGNTTHLPRTSVHVSGGGGSKSPAAIDLREYPDTDAGKDVTDLFRGVKVTGLPNGSSLLAERVIYDPKTQEVTYKEYTDKANASYKTVSLTKFFQDIKTLNPQIDMKFLEGLRTPITGSQPKNEPAKQQTPSSKVKVVLKDGRKGEIPADQLDKFLKDNPGSKRQ